MRALLDAPAHQLASWIREKEVSPVEIIDEHIKRIEEVNPAINAVIVERYDAARKEAKAAEAQVMAAKDPSELPPLLGLPYSSKEYISVDGMPLSAGIWKRRDVKAHQSAETTKRLQKAGAILLGITNVPEGGLWMETYNDVYGRTVNPWNRGRAAGGSSGGDGAILSTGAVSFALGADVGGSIRIPAAFCGTVGHKQSGRMVPNTGFWPPAHGEMNAYLVVGPLTRCVDDVMPLLKVLAGPDGVDPCCHPFELGNPDEVDIDQMVVYPIHDSGFTRTGEVNRHVVDRAVKTMARAGAQVRELDPKRLKKAFMIWSSMMASAGGPKYSQILGDGDDLNIARELVRLGMGRSKHTLPALVIAGVEKITDVLPGEVERSIAAGRALQEELEDLLGPKGILLHPPYTAPAPRHYRAMARPFDFVRTGLFNVLEFPATVVPMGFDVDGLPLSVQCISGRGQDHIALAAAKVLEAGHGGWRRSTPSWTLDTEVGPYSMLAARHQRPA